MSLRQPTELRNVSLFDSFSASFPSRGGPIPDRLPHEYGVEKTAA